MVLSCSATSCSLSGIVLIALVLDCFQYDCAVVSFGVCCLMHAKWCVGLDMSSTITIRRSRGYLFVLWFWMLNVCFCCLFLSLWFIVPFFMTCFPFFCFFFVFLFCFFCFAFAFALRYAHHLFRFTSGKEVYSSR